MDVPLTDLYRLGIALGLGLLVGLEREWSEKQPGIRTFPLITVFGALSGLLARDFGGWILAAGILGVVAMTVVANYLRVRQENASVGMTSESAVLVMFGVGALLSMGETTIAVAVGGAVAVLLGWKRPLHQFVKAIGAADVQAIMRLVLVAFVILPLLPNQAYGPYEVFNPFKVWLMVVMIVGISLGAYLVQKLLGNRVGILLGGILGGLVSSTATTVSSARRSVRLSENPNCCAVVILLASTVMYPRLIAEVAVVSPASLPHVAGPLIALMAFTGAMSWMMIRASGKGMTAVVEERPPSDLRAAVVFGVLYVAVLYIVAFTKERFGNQGLYAVAAISGLTEMDAITLSTAQLMKSGAIQAETGWRLIVTAALSNFLLKAGVVAALGTRGLFGRIAALFGLIIAFGFALLFLWP